MKHYIFLAVAALLIEGVRVYVSIRYMSFSNDLVDIN